MITNADMTIYNKYFDKVTRLDKYNRKIIRNVFWDNNEGAIRVASGLTDADKVLVLIPYESCLDGVLVSSNDFVGDVGTFTFQIGDRIVESATYFDIEDKPNNLDREYRAFTITSIDRKDFGSLKMRHWEIRGK